MKEKVFADDFTKNFYSQSEFLDFLTEREKNSYWSRIRAKDLKFYAMEKGDEITQRLENEYALQGKEDVFSDTIENTRLILQADNRLIPVRSCAIKTILERARISGNALNKVRKSVLSEILNYCMAVTSGEALLRVCEDKITAVHGGDESDYSVLEMPELFKRTVDYLESNFSGYTFAGASYDHLIVTSLWELSKDDALVSTYRESLLNNGIDVGEIKPALRLTTSDAGVSGVNLYPIVFVGSEAKVIPLGNALKLEHKNKADIQRFDEQLNLLYSQYSKALGGIEKLLKITIKNPVNTMLGVMKRIGIPKKLAFEAAELFSIQSKNMSCTAHDIYFGIAETEFMMQYEGSEGSKIAKMEENIARAINIRWTDYDIPGDFRW